MNEAAELRSELDQAQREIAKLREREAHQIAAKSVLILQVAEYKKDSEMFQEMAGNATKQLLDANLRIREYRNVVDLTVDDLTVAVELGTDSGRVKGAIRMLKELLSATEKSFCQYCSVDFARSADGMTHLTHDGVKPCAKKRKCDGVGPGDQWCHLSEGHDGDHRNQSTTWSRE